MKVGLWCKIGKLVGGPTAWGPSINDVMQEGERGGSLFHDQA